MRKIHDVVNYISPNPQNIGILIEIENACGSHFQELNAREKMALIRSLSFQLCMEFSDLEYNFELNDLARLANELSISDRIGLIRCLADNASLSITEEKNGN